MDFVQYVRMMQVAPSYYIDEGPSHHTVLCSTPIVL